MNQANDDEQSIVLAGNSEQPLKDSIEDPKLTLHAEELSVENETVETGRLRLSEQDPDTGSLY